MWSFRNAVCHVAVVTWAKTLSTSSVFTTSRMLEGTYPAWPLRFRSFHHCLPSSSTWQRSVTGQLRSGQSNNLESKRSCGYASTQGCFFLPFLGFVLPRGFHPAALTARWHSWLQSGREFWHISVACAFHHKTCWDRCHCSYLLMHSKWQKSMEGTGVYTRLMSLRNGVRTSGRKTTDIFTTWWPRAVC